MTNTKLCLIVALPEGPVRHYLLSADRITIGRSAENAITLEWDTVSSRHLELRRKGNGYVATDLGSTNGTRLNGKDLKDDPNLLEDGDALVLGTDVKARLVVVVEIRNREVAGDAGDGSATRRLKKTDRFSGPGINPVAAAMAKAAKGRG